MRIKGGIISDVFYIEDKIYKSFKKEEKMKPSSLLNYDYSMTGSPTSPLSSLHV